MVKIVKKIVPDSKKELSSPAEFKINSTELKEVLNFRLLNNPDSAIAVTKARTEQCKEWSKIVRNKIKTADENNKRGQTSEQELIDDILSIQKSVEALQNYITAIIAKNDLSNEQAVECEEMTIKLHKIEKKLRKLQ